MGKRVVSPWYPHSDDVLAAFQRLLYRYLYDYVYELDGSIAKRFHAMDLQSHQKKSVMNSDTRKYGHVYWSTYYEFMPDIEIGTIVSFVRKVSSTGTRVPVAISK